MHHFLFGSPETIAGTVYGTIVVMGAIAAGSQSGEIRTSHLAAVVAVTVLVLWIAHVYSHALAETIRLARRLDGAELASVARRELAIPLAGLMPVASLALGSIGVLRESTASATPPPLASPPTEEPSPSLSISLSVCRSSVSRPASDIDRPAPSVG